MWNKEHNPQRIPTKIVLLVTATLAIMASTPLASDLPNIIIAFESLNNAKLAAQYTLNVIFGAVIIGGPLAGILCDKWQRRGVLIISVLMYAIMGTTGLYLQSLYAILACRFLLGIFLGGVMTSISALITDYYKGHEKTKFIGYQVAAWGVGGIVYLQVGGVLAHINWHLPFVIYIFPILLLPFIFLYVYEPDRKEILNEKNVNDTKSVTVDVSPNNNSEVVTPNEQNKTNSNDTVKSEVQITSKYYIAYIIFNGSLDFWINVLLNTVITQLSIYLTLRFHVNTSLLATASSMVQVMLVITSLFIYRFVRLKLDYIYIYGVAYLCMALGFTISGVAQDYGVVLFGLLFIGMSAGLSNPNSIEWSATVAPLELKGRVIGLITTSANIGEFVSPAIINATTSNYSIADTYLIMGGTAWAIGVILIIGRYIWIKVKPQQKTIQTVNS